MFWLTLKRLILEQKCQDRVKFVGKVFLDLEEGKKLLVLAPLSFYGCFLVLRKLLLVSFCVVVWVLFSVFSIFCITSLVSATPRNHPFYTVLSKVIQSSELISSYCNFFSCFVLQNQYTMSEYSGAVEVIRKTLSGMRDPLCHFLFCWKQVLNVKLSSAPRFIL